MYLPPLFREDRLEAQHAAMRAHPLGLLITCAAGGLIANPVPCLIDEKAGSFGTLKAHLARANPQLAELRVAPECLVVFQGAQAYVSPAWYETKRETGKVVPTWNYVMVHAWGRPRVIDDAAWLRQQIGELTDKMEAGSKAPWDVDDAPADFIAAQIRGIVGVEIEITRIEGKWKVSQNRPLADRQGVVAGLRELGSEAASAMANEVQAKFQE